MDSVPVRPPPAGPGLAVFWRRAELCSFRAGPRGGSGAPSLRAKLAPQKGRNGRSQPSVFSVSVCLSPRKRGWQAGRRKMTPVKLSLVLGRLLHNVRRVESLVNWLSLVRRRGQGAAPSLTLTRWLRELRGAPCLIVPESAALRTDSRGDFALAMSITSGKIATY